MPKAPQSETAGKLMDLFDKYKSFCFAAISKVPYKPVRGWIAFADGRVDDALDEKRGVWESIKQQYVLCILTILAMVVAYWYVSLFLGAILAGITVFLTGLGIIANPTLTIAIVAALAIAIIIAPAVILILSAFAYHVIAKVLGGKGSYGQTMSVLVVGSAANLIFMIPLYIAYAFVIGFLISPLAYAVLLFSLYLEYKGIKSVHKLSSKRSAAVIICGIITCWWG